MSSRVVRSAVALAVLATTHAAGAGPLKGRPTAKPACTRVVAETEAALDVVGVLAQGRKRAILVMRHGPMLDMTRPGYLVRPGECAGRDRVPFDQLFHTSFDDGVVTFTADVAGR